MTTYKHTCSCGARWFNEEAVEIDCEADDSDDDDENGVLHEVKSTSTLTALDWCELMEEELENANRHDFIEVPSILLAIYSEVLKDKKVIRKLMKKTYEAFDKLI